VCYRGDSDDDDDDDDERINFSVALSPVRLQGQVTISLNSEVTYK